MGTHNYRLQVTGKYGGSRLAALTFDQFGVSNTGNWGKLDTEPNEVVYHRDVGCRERVMDFLRELRSRVFCGERDDLLVGIRCFGEMHSKVADIIGTEESHYKRFEKLFSDVFGLSYKIRTEKIKPANSNKFHLGRQTATVVKDGEKINLTFYNTITVYFRSKGNHNIPLSDTKTSAVLAILKESTIAIKIMSGEIFDAKTLIQELVRISHKRLKKEDDSYDYVGWTREDNYNISYEKVLGNAKSQLATNFNVDGSDWKSIAYLAAFCYMCAFPSDSFPITTTSSGPTQYAFSNVTISQLKEMAHFIDISTRTTGIAKRIRELDQHRYEDEKLYKAWRKEKK